MKKWLIVAMLAVLCVPQTWSDVVFGSDGTSVAGWTENSGAWQSVDGAIVRTAPQAANTTHALILDRDIDFTALTYPITLTYDLKVEADNAGAGEVWSGIGISTPSTVNDVEKGAIVVALRANNATKGLNVLVGGRRWIGTENNFAWEPNTWYTIRVTLSNPDFTANSVDIFATIQEKGATAPGASVTMTAAGAGASGTTFELTSNKRITLFSRSSAAGLGGMRYYDNILLESNAAQSHAQNFDLYE